MNDKVVGGRMPKEIPSAFPVKTIRKWLALAYRRKAHLIDLYQSGRWRLYYTEAEFVSRVREAVGEIDRWSATEQAAASAEASDVGHDREWFGRSETRSGRDCAA
jgi:uncharacterized repeat protein (TIGR03809 family)